MIKHALLCCFAFLLVVGCQKPSNHCGYVPYTDEGVLKPRVAFASVTDSSDSKFSWDVSDEIIHGIGYFLQSEGELFAVPQNEVYAKMALLGDVDLYGTNLTPWKSFSNDADFVVLADLFESKEVPYESGKCDPLFLTTGSHGNVLALKLRLKVIDVRGPQPKLVLFEVMDSNHLLPLGYSNAAGAELAWGNVDYGRSITGLVHNRLIYQLTQRINMVIDDVR